MQVLAGAGISAVHQRRERQRKWVWKRKDRPDKQRFSCLKNLPLVCWSLACICVLPLLGILEPSALTESPQERPSVDYPSPAAISFLPCSHLLPMLKFRVHIPFLQCLFLVIHSQDPDQNGSVAYSLQFPGHTPEPGRWARFHHHGSFCILYLDIPKVQSQRVCRSNVQGIIIGIPSISLKKFK